MKQRLLVLVAFLYSVAAPNAVGAAEPTPLLASWLSSQTSVQTWSAEFVQVRTFKSLVEPLTANGRIWFEAPNRFRWELGNPPQTIAVRASTEVVLLYPRLKRAERYPLKGTQTGAWKDALSLLEAGFARSLSELQERYTILSESIKEHTCQVGLEPRSAAARRMMPRIIIEFDTRDLGLRATELQFADGSKLRNEFHNTVLNPGLDSDTFLLAIPPDYRVTEPLRKQPTK